MTRKGCKMNGEICVCGKTHKNLTGSNSSAWKGKKIKYGGLHDWLRKHKFKPRFCEICHNIFAKELANLKQHKYTRNINDYSWVCHLCHKKMDYTEEVRKKMSKRMSGKNHPFFGKKLSKETRKKMSIAQSGKNNPRYGEPRAKNAGMKTGCLLNGKLCPNCGKIHKDKTGKNSHMYGKFGKLNPMYGKHLSEKSRKKMKDAWKLRKIKNKNVTIPN
jgi:hypothetical protein